MSAPKYLIDTNVLIGLEDPQEVSPEFASLLQLAAKHSVAIFIHEASRDDLARDTDHVRRRISLSKAAKFQLIQRVRGLASDVLEAEFGRLLRPNDVVDATLLHALKLGVADFLITEDRGLHERARRHGSELARRVLYVADAVLLLRSNYEPISVSLPFVEETEAHTIPKDDPIFDSLRDGYPDFNQWWAEKCVKGLRKCWIVVDEGRLAGILVRKDETASATDARTPATKILKICTFKVRPERRGIKLGELLLKQAFWFARINKYDLLYVTTFSSQTTLIDLLEYYGFYQTYVNEAGELVYEKLLPLDALVPSPTQSLYDAARLNYPRFVSGLGVQAYAIPIKEEFHEVLFPELVSCSCPYWASRRATIFLQGKIPKSTLPSYYDLGRIRGRYVGTFSRRITPLGRRTFSIFRATASRVGSVS
jgi:GNAT superfamily N-acetyltransferase/predicted nucleic acid-binding protein